MRWALVAVLLTVSLPAGPAGASSIETFRCDGKDGATMAMENEYIVQTGYGPCWFHTGHHTYRLDGLFNVGAITGTAFSVEVQFTPAIELDPAVGIPLVLERSLDGRVWDAVDVFQYRALSTRQEIAFSTDAGGALARYLRLRQPRSAARGLSGYLDSSSLSAELTPAPGILPTPRSGTFTLSCAEDIMETFIAEHPCWFGGINRYDSPSVFHTYPLDATTSLATITGTATFLPWRSDDYTQDGGDRRTLQAHLFASADGEQWTRLSTFSASYGLPAEYSWSGATEASYVRLVAEYHKGVTRHPALKHVRGMLLDSSITITTL